MVLDNYSDNFDFILFCSIGTFEIIDYEIWIVALSWVRKKIIISPLLNLIS